MKKISITFFVITLVVITIALLVTPSVITRTFQERLNRSFVGELSLDSLSGVEFHVLDGFTLDHLQLSLAEDTSNSSLLLKNVSLGISSNSMFRVNEPIILSYISVDTIRITSNNVEGETIVLSDILENSVENLSFSDDFIVSSDEFVWSGPNGVLLLDNAELRRKGGHNYTFSFHDAQYGNTFVSNYLEVNVFGARNSVLGSNELLEPIQLDSLFMIDSSVAFIDPILDQLRNGIDSTAFIMDEAVTVINSISEMILTQVEFDSLSLEKSLSTIRNSDSTLTESSHLEMEWLRDAAGDSITLSIPKIRNMKWPRVDSLFASVRVEKGATQSAAVAFQCDDISVSSLLSFEERKDSGALFISLINNRKSCLYSTALPITFDTLHLSLNGILRNSNDWEIEMAGSIGKASLYDHFPDSIMQFEHINIDTAENCQLTVTPNSIKLISDHITGALDTINFSADMLIVDSEKSSVDGENIYIHQYSGVEIDTIGTISSVKVAEDSSGNLAVSIDSISIHNGTEYSDLHYRDLNPAVAQLWKWKNTVPLLDSLSELQCGYVKFADSSNTILIMDSLTINFGSEIDVVSSAISIPSVGFVSNLSSVIAIDTNGFTVNSIECGALQLVTDSVVTLDSISSIMDDIAYVRNVMIGESFNFRGDLELPSAGIAIKNVELSTHREAHAISFNLFTEKISTDSLSDATTISASGKLYDRFVQLDSSRGTWNRITAQASGKIYLEPNLSCSLRARARNLKLSTIASDILSGHGTVTGYGAGSLNFTGNLRNIDSWEGSGTFLLRNVRIHGLSVQDDGLIDEHATPFKDFRMEEVVCSDFDLFRDQRLHLNNVRGTGESLNIIGWGNLSRSGYFYFEMNGKVHPSTMSKLPRLTRLALNEHSSRNEGEFKAKLFGSPDDQQLVIAKGIGGNVIRSQFRAMGASIKNFFN